MKTTRRIFSMVLALMMILSLSVTAFADTVVKAPDMTVKVVTSPNGTKTNWTIPANVGETVEAALNRKETLNVTIFWKVVNDYYVPTKTHNALVSMRGFESTGFDPDNATDVANLMSYTNNKYSASQIADMTWYTGNYQGYGLIGYDEDTGEYSYIYAGYDWTYSSNTNPQIWDYMCCYTIKDGEAVTLTYDFTVSEWTTTTPLPVTTD